MKLFPRFAAACIAVITPWHDAMADPVTELRCLETEWLQSVTEFRQNRADLWQWMHGFLDGSKPISCSAEAYIEETPNWNLEQEYSWRCFNVESELSVSLGFETPDAEHLDSIRGAMLGLGLAYGFSDPELVNGLKDLAGEFERTISETLKDLEAQGVTITPKVPTGIDIAKKEQDSANARSKETVSAQDIFGSALPIQNSWGLTAQLSWHPDAFEVPKDMVKLTDVTDVEDMRARIKNILDIQRILRDLERTQKQPGSTMQAAAAAYARAIELTEGKAHIWSREHVPLAARKFRLFGAPVQLVQREDNSISVIDMRSWSRLPETDWQSDADTPMVEGVNEVVFYYEPHPDYVDGSANVEDCKITKTFPCPPLNNSRAKTPAVIREFAEACADAVGCQINTLRWINDHVAIRTHLRARNTDATQLARFTRRLTTLRTKTLLSAFTPDPEFDAPNTCQ
ncbi:hypothetical protein HW561_02220 [Rhodobacteraceae bacterium B1Z28]|uniref:Uncharacterized protein n=1 Tax=Ruegeria haliotis TaxID=2747601 RepID=A0ABX2PKQ6_9RHOB|nr:hypothetical protein [Ruegeria haliotis]NVO54603.1 hypothetical protein [Ruegeria haliotis]